ncbi:MAG TPA: hypothetical protein VH139_06005 [Acidobacteriaceae bacterium]|jgi:hypothetical protein|nr:hypothetical protein [Acidobacteriaceae bacterium]
MRSISSLCVVALLWVSSSVSAWPQTLAAPAQVVTLGNSAVALTGPWKFSPGDSPWIGGSPVWAQPGFDDAHWATMDLAPKAGSVDLVNGIAGFVPG